MRKFTNSALKKVINKTPHNKKMEKVVEAFISITDNDMPDFFRAMYVFYAGFVASSLRVRVAGLDGFEAPANVYSILLAPSGAGKNRSSNLFYNYLLTDFNKRFLKNVFHPTARQHIESLSLQLSKQDNNRDLAEIESELITEFRTAGKYLMMFETATQAGLKQTRTKLQLANSGALNWRMDELADNLGGTESLLGIVKTYWDEGLEVNRLLKNTREQNRVVDLSFPVPMNMLLLGTPSKLLDSTQLRDQLFTNLDSGYARRSFITYYRNLNTLPSTSLQELYAKKTDSTNKKLLDKYKKFFASFAQKKYLHTKITFADKEAKIYYIAYDKWCKERAMAIPGLKSIEKNEMAARAFKMLKLAAIFTFIEGFTKMSSKQLIESMKITESSGEHLAKLLDVDEEHIILLKYLAEANIPLTHSTLKKQLPFYPKQKGARNDLLELAQAASPDMNIVMKTANRNGIEYIKAQYIERTKSKFFGSFSNHIARDFKGKKFKFEELQKLLNQYGNWVVCPLKKGKRNRDNVKAKFNLIVFDVDGTANIHNTKKILKDYTYLMYTTGSNKMKKKKHYFRIVFPLSHTLDLTRQEFKQFYKNIQEWLPIQTDLSVNQPERNWKTYKSSQYFSNNGKKLDVQLFMPNTNKSSEIYNKIQSIGSLDRLQKWFVLNTVEGSRNNMLYRFGKLLYEAGEPRDRIMEQIEQVNDQLKPPMSKAELTNTVFKSLFR